MMMRATNGPVVLGNLKNRRLKRGFTLMELLTVMGIVSILLTVASVGVSRIERGSALTTALAVSEGLFNEARTIAISEGVKTRVMIHNDAGDTENPERYHRYMAIAVQQKNNNGEPSNDFKIETRGSLLPAGVFFDEKGSTKLANKVSSSNAGSFGTFETNGRIDFPAMPSSEQASYYYEFNSEGICVVSGKEPGAAFVLSDGNNGPQGQAPILDDDNKSAFVIWRNGSTSLYKDTSAFN